MNDKHPLFLPKGSVRAVLAIMLVGGTLYATLSGLQVGTNVLYTLTGSALAHYFAARGSIGGAQG